MPARLRDSWPLRIGAGIVLFVIAAWTVVYIASELGKANPSVGPAGIWSLCWLILGLGLVIVGIGQTAVRRRMNRKE